MDRMLSFGQLAVKWCGRRVLPAGGVGGRTVARMSETKQEKLPKKPYERELARLQAELVTLQEWVRSTGARVVVIFEGRDAAGKGGAIKRVTECLSPRVAHVAALPAPTERQ